MSAVKYDQTLSQGAHEVSSNDLQSFIMHLSMSYFNIDWKIEILSINDEYYSTLNLIWNLFAGHRYRQVYLPQIPVWPGPVSHGFDPVAGQGISPPGTCKTGPGLPGSGVVNSFKILHIFVSVPQLIQGRPEQTRRPPPNRQISTIHASEGRIQKRIRPKSPLLLLEETLIFV